MKVWDPVQRRVFAQVDVQQLPAIGVVVPTRGRGPDDPWFAHVLWTNESRRIEDLPASLQEDVRRAIARNDLQERLLQRLSELDAVAPLEEAEAVGALARACEVVGLADSEVEAVISRARASGFTTSEIALALSSLEDATTLSDALDGVEVVSVGRIAAKMRASTA